jgi:hypothetical protein
MAKRKKRVKRSQGKQTPVRRSRAIKRWNGIAIGGALVLLLGFIGWAPNMRNAGATEVVVYKSPSCGCCSKWVDYLRDEGFKVTTHNSNSVDQIKMEHGVSSKLKSCHTALVEGYVVEGHVPAMDIKSLLQEKPDVTGLAVPGMPMGSPGMEGKYKDPYDVLAFTTNGKTEVYASH